MQVLPPWIAIPRGLRVSYRYLRFDRVFPPPGKLVLVQCEEGTWKARPQHVRDPKTGKLLVQFVSEATGHPVTNPRCFYPIAEDSQQPHNEQKVS